MNEQAGPGPDPDRDENLRYIEQMSVELAQIAERTGAGMIVYLLGMVREEAANEMAARGMGPGRPRRRRTPG